MIDISAYLSSFKETSWDPMKGESLINDDYYPVYNFDSITTAICREWRMGENLSSCDGLILTDKIYLVEFKNQRMMNIDKKVLHKKAFDTLYLLQRAAFEYMSLEELGKKCVLYVVHVKSESASFDSFRAKVAGFAKENHPIDFALSKYRKLYSDVYTVGRDDFIKEHIPRIFKARPL